MTESLGVLGYDVRADLRSVDADVTETNRKWAQANILAKVKFDITALNDSISAMDRIFNAHLFKLKFDFTDADGKIAALESRLSRMGLGSGSGGGSSSVPTTSAGPGSRMSPNIVGTSNGDVSISSPASVAGAIHDMGNRPPSSAGRTTGTATDNLASSLSAINVPSATAATPAQKMLDESKLARVQEVLAAKSMFGTGADMLRKNAGFYGPSLAKMAGVSVDELMAVANPPAAPSRPGATSAPQSTPRAAAAISRPALPPGAPGYEGTGSVEGRVHPQPEVTFSSKVMSDAEASLQYERLGGRRRARGEIDKSGGIGSNRRPDSPLGDMATDEDWGNVQGGPVWTHGIQRRWNAITGGRHGMGGLGRAASAYGAARVIGGMAESYSQRQIEMAGTGDVFARQESDIKSITGSAQGFNNRLVENVPLVGQSVVQLSDLGRRGLNKIGLASQSESQQLEGVAAARLSMNLWERTQGSYVGGIALSGGLASVRGAFNPLNQATEARNSATLEAEQAAKLETQQFKNSFGGKEDDPNYKAGIDNIETRKNIKLQTAERTLFNSTVEINAGQRSNDTGYQRAYRMAKGRGVEASVMAAEKTLSDTDAKISEAVIDPSAQAKYAQLTQQWDTATTGKDKGRIGGEIEALLGSRNIGKEMWQGRITDFENMRGSKRDRDMNMGYARATTAGMQEQAAGRGEMAGLVSARGAVTAFEDDITNRGNRGNETPEQLEQRKQLNAAVGTAERGVNLTTTQRRMGARSAEMGLTGDHLGAQLMGIDSAEAGALEGANPADIANIKTGFMAQRTWAKREYNLNLHGLQAQGRAMGADLNNNPYLGNYIGIQQEREGALFGKDEKERGIINANYDKRLELNSRAEGMRRYGVNTSIGMTASSTAAQQLRNAHKYTSASAEGILGGTEAAIRSVNEPDAALRGEQIEGLRRLGKSQLAGLKQGVIDQMDSGRFQAVSSYITRGDQGSRVATQAFKDSIDFAYGGGDKKALKRLGEASNDLRGQRFNDQAGEAADNAARAAQAGVEGKDAPGSQQVAGAGFKIDGWDAFMGKTDKVIEALQGVGKAA